MSKIEVYRELVESGEESFAEAYAEDWNLDV